MLIHLLQLSVNENNINENLQKANTELDKLQGGGIAILPELFIPGYREENILLCAQKDKEIISAFQQSAKKNKIAITGTFAVREYGKRFNRALFIADDGTILSHYDKTHLFRLMKEDKYFEAGNRYPVFEYKGWKIGINTCYDIRFPEAQRALYHQGAELIILPAAWPHNRIEILKKLAYARAIENQCFFVSLNRASKQDQPTTYGGNSMLISPAGELLTCCRITDECLSLDINLDDVRTYRKLITCHEDRRDDIYSRWR